MLKIEPVTGLNNKKVKSAKLRFPFPQSGLSVYIIGASLLIAGFWTLVFYPAAMSPDSLTQWAEAQSNNYTDWHPLGMTLLMRMVIRLMDGLPVNSQVAMFAFLQGTLFWLAIFYTVVTFVSSARLKIALLLTIPFYYPLWLYTVTLWKDVWAATWLLLFVCELYRLLYKDGPPRWHFRACILLGSLSLLTRYNTLLAFLIMGLAVVALRPLLTKKKGWLKSGGLIATILILSALITTLINSLVPQLHYGNFNNLYLSYDLVGTLHFIQPQEDLTRLATATYKQYGAEKMLKAIEGYSCSLPNMNYLIWGDNPPFGQDAMLASDSAIKDLPGLAISHPLAFFQHKICVLDGLLNVSNKAINYPHNYNIYPNSMSLVEDSRLPGLNQFVVSLLGVFSSTDSWFILPYRNGLVLILALLACIIRLALVRRVEPNIVPAIFLLIVGIAYFLPYTFTVPGSDWRYLLFCNISWMLSLAITAGCFVSNFSDWFRLRFQSRQNPRLDAQILE